MFGLGMGEIVLIAVVALLVLGPERLPGAAKAIGKGIRDLRQQTKALQATIESDTQIGDAVREIKGALRGDPETLYKKVTGDDWQGSDSPPIVSSPENSSEKEGEQGKSDDATKSGESGSSDNEDSNRESLKGDDAKSDSSNGDDSEKESSGSAAPATATRDFVKELIDKEFSNTDDAWGKAPSNPHEGDDSSNDDSSDIVEANASEPDPDMPIIKPASNTMARHEVIDDESEDDQNDQASTDTANV
ncbi:MAG: twin-arginine translocase TatA/TatE family subunit [Kofleriaceae bacterium]|nr:twin-arginine translocase TatA/TatE family subunit [Kofleriaceae bacterium]